MRDMKAAAHIHLVLNPPILQIEETPPPFYPDPRLRCEYFALCFKTDLELQIKQQTQLRRVERPFHTFKSQYINSGWGPNQYDCIICQHLLLYNCNRVAGPAHVYFT